MRFNKIILVALLVLSLCGIFIRATLSTNTIKVDSNFWSTLTDHMMLNDAANNPQVQKQIKVVLANKAEFEQTLAASRPYMPYIYAQTQARKLPAELTIIPIIESEYDPNNTNSIGAKGLWQLMPETAHLFGIKTTGKNDGRVNTVIATNAALSYFNDLSTYYKGNWELVFAAYNSGQGTVDHAVKHAGSDDFFQLSLPKDTEAYVPRVLAIALILKNPDKYGVTLPTMA